MNDITKFGLTPIPPASAKRPISQSFRSRNHSEERKSELHSAFYSIEEDIYEIQKVIDRFLNLMCESESDIPRGKISSRKSFIPSVRNLASRIGNYSATVTQLRNGALVDIVFNIVSNVLGSKYANLSNDMLIRLIALKAQMLEMLVKKIGELALLKLSRNEEKCESDRTCKVIIELCKIDGEETRATVNDTVIESLQQEIEKLKSEYSYKNNIKIQEMEKENAELKDRIKKKQDDVDKLLLDLKSLKDVEFEKKALEKRVKDFKEIENEKKSLEQRLKEIENDKKALEIKLNEFININQEKKALENRLKDYKNIESEKTALELKLTEFSNILKDKKNLEVRLKEVAEDSASFIKLLKDKDQLIFDLTRSLQESQQLIHNKEQEFILQLKEVQTLTSKKRQLTYCKYQVLNIPSHKEAHDRLFTKYSLENSEYLEKLKIYEKEIKDKITSITELKKELEIVKHNLNTAETNYSDILIQKETYELELTSYKSANLNLKETISQYESRLISAQTEIDRIKFETISTFDNKMRRYEAQITAHQDTETYYKNELKDFRFKLIEYKDIMESQLLKIDSLEDTNKYLRSALEKADEVICNINSKQSAFESYGDEDTFENVMKSELAMMRNHYEQKLQVQRSEISSLKQKFTQEMRRIQDQASMMDRKCKLYEVQMQSYLKGSK